MIIIFKQLYFCGQFIFKKMGNQSSDNLTVTNEYE